MKPVALAVLVSLSVVPGLPAQSPGPTRVQPIRGRVVDVRNDVPLRRARVVLSSVGRRIDSVFTDDEGRFSIAAVPSDVFSVRASKAGFASALVTLAPDRVDTDLRFALSKSAAVTGRVLESTGAPAVGVFVRGKLIVPTTRNVPAASTQFFTQTDRLGECRLGNLTAGRYEITAVRIRPESARPGPAEELAFGPPESLEVARGTTTMSLAAGDETHDVDFTISSMSSCPPGPSVRPPPGAVTTSILGRVTSTTGEPLVCAAVRAVGQSDGVPPVYTNRQGRYSLEGLPAGSFVVEARLMGYSTIKYGQRHPSDAETAITLREGQRQTRVDIVLPRQSSVSGNVVDEYGEPLEGVSVWPLKIRRSGGRMTLGFAVNTLPGSTDDRGQYRLIGLEPGTYLIAAMAKDPVSDANDGARGYATIFYPGVTDALTAQRLTLDAGRDAHGVDFALTPIRTAIVSGTVFDGAGRPFAGTVTVAASTRSGVVSVDARAAATDAKGGFLFRNVPPGDYVVKAGQSSGPARFAMQYVTVVDGDPPPITLTVSDGATLHGRIVIDGLSQPNIAGLGVSVISADPDYSPVGSVPGQPAMWALNDDGTFRAAGVRGPSRVTITPTPACASCYLRSALVNGTDAADRPFDFGLTGGVYRDVEVVVSDAGATIEGRAISDRYGGVTAFSVVVFSTSRDLWYPGSRYMKTRRSGPDGTVRVTALPPGDYYVAAVTGLEFSPFFEELDDPDVLEPLSARAQQVTLTEREHRTLTLRLTRRPDSQP